MKKLFQTLCLTVLPALTFAHSHAEYVGLVGELTHLKMCGENLAMSMLNDSNTSPEFKAKVIEQYNELRTLDDQFILQLSADSRTKRGLCNYRKLDKMLTCNSMAGVKKDYYNKNHHYKNEKIEGYVWNLILLHKAHKRLAELKDEAYSKGGAYSFTGLNEGHKDNNAYGYASINDISSCRERKVERITFMLDDLRMCPVQKLIKKEKKVKKAHITKMEHTVKFDNGNSSTWGSKSYGIKSHKKHTKYCKCK
ncbi:MAG: hypothetical protein WC716_10985 [Chitinophagaceae bacterium]|jgi:hypothetical protein